VGWQSLLALLLGSAMPFAFSPYDHAWLALPALTGWLLLIRCGRPTHIGLAFGFGWFGFGAWWLMPTLHTYGNLPWLAAGFCVVLVGLVMAMLPALWAWLSWRLAGRSAWIILVFPAVAVLEEWLRGHLFTGLPWTALGNLLLGLPAAGRAPRVGRVVGVHIGADADRLERNTQRLGCTDSHLIIMLIMRIQPIDQSIYYILSSNTYSSQRPDRLRSDRCIRLILRIELSD